MHSHSETMRSISSSDSADCDNNMTGRSDCKAFDELRLESDEGVQTGLTNAQSDILQDVQLTAFEPTRTLQCRNTSLAEQSTHSC